ncbi:MAG TPA: hypothetical protein VJ726_04045 [Candidatus Limnocylindria bacterium]|nr:hypothetical protein [Candidatus Limnocylindria bacterium]
MKKLFELIAVIALLNIGGGAALADDPQVSVTPDVRTDPAAPGAGGSASANSGSAGPATVSSSQPVSVSSTTSPAPGAGQSSGSTSASGPGTSANAPLGATTAEPDPTPPDGSAPATTTTGPDADADASRTSVSTTESGGVRATIVSNATGAFGGSASGIGSAQDPTNVASCTTAEATPGTPTDLSLGTACGAAPTTASEDVSANEANGNGGGGTPSASSCLAANASAGVSPSAGIADACASPGGSTPSTTPATTGTNGGGGTSVGGGYGSTGFEAVAGAARTAAGAALIGLGSLPFTGTAAESLGSFGVLLGMSGLALLYLRRRGLTWELARAIHRSGR